MLCTALVAIRMRQELNLRTIEAMRRQVHAL
jgi:hypothetical protein